MKYQSKKDPTIFMEVLSEDEKYKTVEFKFLTGPETGKTADITISTLKRWWKKVDEPDTTKFEDTIDYEKVNTPYPEPKEQKYIPKPKSVIEYEAKRGKKYNNELPTHEEISETLLEHLSKVNKTYVVLKESKCWLERKSGYINLYATEDVWNKLTDKGFTSRANGMKNTPLKFVFKIETIDEYNTILEVLLNE